MEGETLLILNQTNKNRRLYTIDSFTNLDFKKSWVVTRTCGSDESLNIGDICGQIVDMKILDDKIVGTFAPLDSYERPSNMIIRPKSLGTVDDGVIRNAVLLNFYFVSKEDDAFFE